MTQEEVLNAFKSADALLEGHFILSSGRRSPVFLQKALVFAQPKVSEALCAALAEQVHQTYGEITVVTGPAVGGIIPGYEMARQLGARAMFAEREEGELTYRRGFEFHPDDRILLMEDIVTTGKSFRETVKALDNHPGELVGGACIIDRSNGQADVGTKLLALARVDFPDYDPDDLPESLRSLPPVKPGSRGLK